MPYCGTQLRSLLFSDFSVLWARFYLRIPKKKYHIIWNRCICCFRNSSHLWKWLFECPEAIIIVWEKYTEKNGIIQISLLHTQSSSGMKYLLEVSLWSAFSSHSADYYFREIFMESALLKHLLFSITISFHALLGTILWATWSSHLHLHYIFSGKVRYCSWVCIPGTCTHTHCPTSWHSHSIQSIRHPSPRKHFQ